MNRLERNEGPRAEGSVNLCFFILHVVLGNVRRDHTDDHESDLIVDDPAEDHDREPPSNHKGQRVLGAHPEPLHVCSILAPEDQEQDNKDNDGEVEHIGEDVEYELYSHATVTEFNILVCHPLGLLVILLKSTACWLCS